MSKLSQNVVAYGILVMVVTGIVFAASHHKVYGNCHQTADGRVCTLIRWEGNK
jgi:hypothetical protein